MSVRLTSIIMPHYNSILAAPDVVLRKMVCISSPITSFCSRAPLDRNPTLANLRLFQIQKTYFFSTSITHLAPSARDRYCCLDRSLHCAGRCWRSNSYDNNALFILVCRDVRVLVIVPINWYYHVRISICQTTLDNTYNLLRFLRNCHTPIVIIFPLCNFSA